MTSFIRDIFKNLPTEKLNIIAECNFNGDELSGIISRLKSKQGDKAVTLSGGGYPHLSYPISNLIDFNVRFLSIKYKC